MRISYNFYKQAVQYICCIYLYERSDKITIFLLMFLSFYTSFCLSICCAERDVHCIYVSVLVFFVLFIYLCSSLKNEDGRFYYKNTSTKNIIFLILIYRFVCFSYFIFPTKIFPYFLFSMLHIFYFYFLII